MNAMVQAFQGLGAARVVTMTVVGVILLATFAALSMRLTSPVLSPLYANLSEKDSGVVVSELGAMGVDFQVAGNGTIMVDSSKVLNVRMALAQKGLPSRGSIVGYEIFDRENALGTSEFVYNVNFLRALEGELARTIGVLSAVRSARVHLVMPKPGLFQKEKVEPSASVVLTLNDNTRLAKNEAAAVRHLASSAVPGLRPSRVTVVDSNGNVLAKGESEDDAASISGGDSEEYRANFEARMKRTIEVLLEQVAGAGRVRAEVSADIAFDRVVTNSEKYDPDGQVARSIQSTTESSQASEAGGGAVSVANNLPGGAAAGGAASPGNNSQKTDEITNFEISKTVTNHVSQVGTVKKISVAIVVDGKYEGAEGEQKYAPRTDEELEQLRTLAKSAMGYDEARGDTVQVVNMQFSRDGDQFVTQEGAFDWLKRDLDSILKTVVVGVVAVLAILLVIRPLVNRAFDISPADAEAVGAAASAAKESTGFTGGAESELDMIQTDMTSSSTRRISETIDNNPEETLAVIRGWLTEKA